MKDMHTHSVRALALVEIAIKILRDARVETISAIGYQSGDTLAVTKVMQAVEELRPRLESLVNRAENSPAVQRTRTKDKR